MDHAGKVERISRTQGSPRESMVFGYGASGSRIVKQVGADPDLGTGYREQYVHDAQGNVMAIYQFTPAPDQNTPLSFAVTQRPIYGSSRLGLDAATLEFSDPNYNENDPVDNGKVRYELTDHLGSVCAFINDVAEGYSTDADPESEEWHPELLSAQEYEPFGSLLPGRNFSSTSYRFGFQNQEKDDEIYGSTGTSIAFEYRMHDTRIGRFLSLDPLAAKYPHNSPYAFSENKLIHMVELEGLEAEGYGHRMNHIHGDAKKMREYNKQMEPLFPYAVGATAVMAGGMLALPWLVGGSAASGTAIGVTTAATLESAAYTSPIWGPELVSFGANLFYEGADDPFPTSGPGGELGKALRGT